MLPLIFLSFRSSTDPKKTQKSRAAAFGPQAGLTAHPGFGVPWILDNHHCGRLLVLHDDGSIGRLLRTLMVPAHGLQFFVLVLHVSHLVV